MNSANSAPIAIGDVIGGRYRLEGTLGEGGMAAVYRARHLGTGRACALKLVHAQLITQPALVEMFIREAQVGAKIGPNPHIVDVIDAAADDARRVPFLVMELLEGVTLDQWREANGPMPAPLLLHLFGQLGDALTQAHRAGVIHRDLKPSNLFLTRDRGGGPLLKVLDFGIAKVLESDARRNVTQVGTPSYAAPEQLGAMYYPAALEQGIQIAKAVSPATDVWAMGLIAYELLTGLPGGQYWSADSAADLPKMAALGEYDAPTQRAGDRAGLLPPGFNGWFARCLRKNAAERWQTVVEAVAELSRVLSAPPVSAGDTENGASSYPPAPGYQPQQPQQPYPPYQGPPPAALPLGAAPQLPYGPPPHAGAGYTAGPFPQQGPPVLGGMPVYGAAPGYGAPPPYGWPVPPPGPRKESSSRAIWVIPVVVISLFVVSLAGAFVFYAVKRFKVNADAHSCEVSKTRCEEACDASDTASCARLAHLREVGGAGVAKDLTKAADLYQRACDAGDLSSCAELGRFHLTGKGGIAQDPTSAVALVTRACDGGSARGCSILGELLRDGQAGLKADDARAVQLFKQACDGKVMSACKNLGGMNEYGRGGLAKDLGRASALYGQACDGGDPAGCNDLGVIYDTGRGVTKNEARGGELFKQACDGGEPIGCCNLALMHENGRGGLPKDEARARELYTRACDDGAALGCKALGSFYETGKAGLVKDPARAAGLYKRACDARYAAGCYQLGTLEENGTGVAKDDVQAAAHYKLACDASNGFGCFGLAGMNEAGRGGFGKDDAKAATLYKRGCDLGGPLQSCSAYGILIAYGRVSRDATAAAPYFKQACDGENPAGCSNLGYFYVKGMGVPKDRGRGADLLRKGCTAGYEWACNELKLNGLPRGL